MTGAETPKSTQPTARELLRHSSEQLRAAEVDTPMLDAQVLLSRAMGADRTYLMAHPEAVPSVDAARRFREWVDRRSAREPLAYIIGEREFYDFIFKLTPDVLIPRPETETLVETSISLLRERQSPLVADIGVGSGAVAVSIARAVPDAVVYATDTSPEALRIAAENAQRAGVGERVTLLEGDLLVRLSGQVFDLIVSNPPYIPSSEIDALQPEIARYEPRQALDGGPDGLDCYRRIVANASGYLGADGFVAVEVGAGQSHAVASLFESAGLSDVRSVRDYSGIERVVLGRREQA